MKQNRIIIKPNAKVSTKSANFLVDNFGEMVECINQIKSIYDAKIHNPINVTIDMPPGDDNNDIADIIELHSKDFAQGKCNVIRKKKGKIITLTIVY